MMANGNTVLQTLATYSNLNKNTAYELKSFNLNAYKGQKYHIKFVAVENGSQATSFHVDNVNLNVTY
jgi:hypothetical protein